MTPKNVSIVFPTAFERQIHYADNLAWLIMNYYMYTCNIIQEMNSKNQINVHVDGALKIGTNFISQK